jgi:hypothetical protein
MWLGRVQEEGLYAFSNNTPRLASASMFGEAGRS